MKDFIKPVFIAVVLMAMHLPAFAQLNEILALLPEPKDFNNVDYKERVGWGFTTEKDGTKVIMLYHFSYSKYDMKNAKFLFGITISPDKSFFVADYEYGESREGASVTADGSRAVTGIFYSKNKPKYFEATCEKSESDGVIKYISESSSYDISMTIDKNELYIGGYSNGTKNGEGLLIKDQVITKGRWSNGVTEGTLLQYTFDGQAGSSQGEIKAAKRSYSKSSDAQFSGTAPNSDQCVTFVYRQSSMSFTGGASISYYYVFITVNEAYGQSKANIVAAAREYVETEISFPDEYEEYEVAYNDVDCTPIKEKALSGNSSAPFAVYRIYYERYSPDREEE